MLIKNKTQIRILVPGEKYRKLKYIHPFVSVPIIFFTIILCIFSASREMAIAIISEFRNTFR